jgi:hypothetical protein
MLCPYQIISYVRSPLTPISQIRLIALLELVKKCDRYYAYKKRLISGDRELS